MANLRNRLRDLFFSYLARIEREKNSYNYRPPSYYNNGGNYPSSRVGGLSDDDFGGIIYFYEWSNANSSPKAYYTLKAFESFLDKSGIYVPTYQWELIRHIEKCYIACRKDGKELIIKCNWDSLKHALETEDRPSNPFRSTGSPFYAPPSTDKKGSENERLPYRVQVTHPPIKRPMVYEPEGRWDECEQVGNWFG